MTDSRKTYVKGWGLIGRMLWQLLAFQIVVAICCPLFMLTSSIGWLFWLIGIGSILVIWPFMAAFADKALNRIVNSLQASTDENAEKDMETN